MARRISAALWRGFLALGRLGVAWSPTLLLIALGAVYLFNCLQVLAAPGTGFKFAYVGRGGTVWVEADSYSIDPVTQTATATGLSVVDSNGQIVARAKHVFAARRAETIDLSVFSATAKIVRRKDGTFSTLDLLPPLDPDATPKPIHLRLDRAEVTLEDRTRPQTLTERFALDGVEFSSDGTQNVVSAHLAWAGVLEANIQAAFDRQNRFKAQIGGLKADLLRARPAVAAFLDPKATADLNRWQADSLFLDGEATLSGDEKSISSGHGEFSLTGQGLRHPDYVSGAQLAARISIFPTAALVTARLQEPGRWVTWDGPLSWEGGFSGNGKVQVELAESRRAWPFVARTLPKDVSVEGARFEGVVAFAKGQYSASGQVVANRARMAGQQVDSIAGNVVADADRVSLVIDHATWQSAAVKGWLTADYRGNFLAGEAETVGDRVVPLEFDLQNGSVVLAARAKALVTGTPADPQVLADLTGFAQLNLGEREYLLGEVDSRVEWRNGTARFDRAVVSGPNGVLSATGSVDTAKQTLALQIEAGGVDLSAYADQLTGVGYGTGTVTGTFQEPRAVMEATVLNLRIGDTVLPRTEATLAFDGQVVSADRLVSVFGLGRVTGQATYTLDSGAVTAHLAAKDIFVADLLPDSPAVGRVDAPQILIAGTLEHPTVDVTAHSSDLIFGGVPVDSADIHAAGTLSDLSVDRLLAKIGTGQVSGRGTFDTTGPTGSFEFEASGLPLDRLPVDAELFEVSGQAGAAGKIHTDRDGKWTGQADLSVEGLRINAYDAGSGQFQLNLENNVATLSGGVSSLSGLIEFPQAAYRLDTQDTAGTLLVTNVELGGIIRAASRQIDLPDLQAERVVRDLEGLVSAEVGFAQVDGKWSVDVKSLVASQLESLGRSLGVIDLAGTGSATEAELKRLIWKAPTGGREGAPESIAELIGKWKKGEDTDQISAQGRLVGFDPYTLNLFMEGAPVFHARVDADFVAEGPTDNFSGQASLSVGDFEIQGEDGKLIPLDLSANVDTIEYESHVLSASGKLRYRGIEGDIVAIAPRSAFDDRPEGRAEANLTLSRRPISALADYFPGLDYERTNGSIFGQIRVSGNRDGYVLGGEARFGEDASGPAQIGLKGTSLTFKNAVFSLLTAGERVTLTGQADGAQGGHLAVQGDINLRRFLQGDMNIEALKSATIEGGLVQIDGLKFSEKIQFANPGAGPGEPDILAADRPTNGVLDGTVTIGGTVGKPVVSGNLEGENLNVTLPAEFPSGGGGGVLPIDPRFQDFRMVARPGSVINIPTGSIKLNGSAILNGNLSEIEVRAPLTVQSGEMNLPSSQIKLEEGTVIVTLGASGEPRADLNLEGWTVVTVRRTSDQYQTYRLSLQIQGNLLDPDNVRINGSSDPPDLTVEEIRAIIGQRDFIQSIADSAFGRPDQKSGLTQSLFSLAIPSLTQRFTGDLATALDLDYLALDYNPFDGAVIRGGRELAKGLMVEGSRQVSRQASDTLKFEFRLSYRPPTKDPLFSRFRVFAGFNEQVPWKVGISYATRF